MCVCGGGVINFLLPIGGISGEPRREGVVKILATQMKMYQTPLPHLSINDIRPLQPVYCYALVF